MEIVKTTGYEVPIHAIPQSKWDQLICKELIPRILTMLSVDLSRNQHRIAATELMIRESANRISPADIEKAFMMYIKGQLPGLEPKDNYLTPILFTKVITAYKEQQRPKPKQWEPPQLSDKEKADLIYTGLINCYDAWYQEKRVVPGYQWCYDHLDELKLIKFSKEEKLAAMEESKKRIKAKRSLLERAKEEIETTPAHISEAKRILLEQYFEGVTKEQFIKSIQ